MKKLLLLLLMIAGTGITMQAQITLGTGHLPQIGDWYSVGIDSQYYWVDEPVYDLGPGTNKTWDMSVVDTDGLSGAVYKAASAGSAAADFPTADMTGPFLGGEGYFKFDNDSVKVLGYAGSPSELVAELDVSVPFIPDLTLIPPNFTYGDVYTDDYAFYTETGAFTAMGVSVDSSKISVTGTIKYDANGWGNFTTPYGTWDVLRIERTEYRFTQIDVLVPFFGWQDVSLFTTEGIGYDTLTTIMFVNDMETEPIMEFSVIPTANDPNVLVARPHFKVPDSLIPVSNTPQRNFTIKAYPNPATEDVSLEMIGLDTGDYSIHVFNMLGRQLFTESIYISGDNSVRLDVSRLHAGTYLYNVVDAYGNVLTTKRLVVIHP